MRKLAMAILLGAVVLPGGAAQSQNGKDAVYDELNLFDQAFERIRQDSVDPVGDGKLIGAAIAGMLAGLDPHAAYIDPAKLKSSPNAADDDEPGIGLVVTIDNGELKVISPRDGSPAAQAGIEPGDLIFAIGKEPTFELTLAQAKERLRGPAGSTVILSLRRGGGAPIHVSVKRAVYQPQTVSSRLLPGGIGYLRIAGFDGGTQAAAAAALQDLRQKAGGKLAGLALDLRNNPGGNFDAAVKLADGFIDKGDVAVIKGRDPADTKRIAGTPGDLVKGLPIVAIVNGGTAREAELVAGALQDDHRAVLLGTRTYGDGNIETLIPARQRRRDPPDHRPLYDTLGSADPGQGARPRSRGYADQARKAGRRRGAARGRSSRGAEEPGSAELGRCGRGAARPPGAFGRHRRDRRGE